MPVENIAVLILAAGNSERMGCDKASLPFGNGLTFTGQLVSVYSSFGCSPIIMVVNERSDIRLPAAVKVKFILNKNLKRGRSWSVQLGLQNIPSGHACFIQNIDNPFTTTILLEQMKKELRQEAYVVPTFEGRGGHPVLLGSSILDELREKKVIPNLRKDLEKYKRVEVLSDSNGIHLNINTPDDYREFMKPG